MSAFHGGKRMLWRWYGRGEARVPASRLFGGVEKRGKLWIAAYYADGGAYTAPAAQELRLLGYFKSGAHAYAALGRRMGEFKAAEAVGR